MATLAARGSGTPATTGTTWASVTNAVDGTAGTNPATYATYTNAAASAVATIEITGYGFSSSIGASDTLNSVTVSLRHFENNTGRFASVTVPSVRRGDRDRDGRRPARWRPRPATTRHPRRHPRPAAVVDVQDRRHDHRGRLDPVPCRVDRLRRRHRRLHTAPTGDHPGRLPVLRRRHRNRVHRPRRAGHRLHRRHLQRGRQPASPGPPPIHQRRSPSAATDDWQLQWEKTPAATGDARRQLPRHATPTTSFSLDSRRVARARVAIIPRQRRNDCHGSGSTCTKDRQPDGHRHRLPVRPHRHVRHDRHANRVATSNIDDHRSLPHRSSRHHVVVRTSISTARTR